MARRRVRRIKAEPRLSRSDFFSEGAVGSGVEAQGLSLEERAEATRGLNHFLRLAVGVGASDLHLEPFGEAFEVRLRLDGRLMPVESPDAELGKNMIARLKLLSGMDMAERRRPQDAKLAVEHDQRSVEFRISVIPTVFGEAAVIRVLDRGASGIALDRLGFSARDRGLLEEALARPSGLILTTGPTGSGKTTTLYSALEMLDREELKLLTVEDPIEHDLAGAVQLEVRPDIGLDFAAALRSALRHDPDVVLVGEIRDRETAEIALDFALTGHLVLSSLHTREAIGAVMRLLDLGIAPPILAEALILLIAQRLLARVCEDCVSPVTLSKRALAALGDEARPLAGIGCPACRQTGFGGRQALFEVAAVDEELAAAIERGAPAQELRSLVRARGASSLSDQARALVCAGAVEPEEGARIDADLAQALYGGRL